MTGLLLTGCGVALGSVDLTWRCVIIACRRSLSFASCNEKIEHITFFFINKSKKINSMLIPCIPSQWRHLFQSVSWNRLILLFLRLSNYLFWKCFWKPSTTLHFRQSNYCLLFKVKRYCVSLPISPGPFYCLKLSAVLAASLNHGDRLHAEEVCVW